MTLREWAMAWASDGPPPVFGPQELAAPRPIAARTVLDSRDGRMKCLACGTSQAVPFPMSMNSFAALCKSFPADHADRVEGGS